MATTPLNLVTYRIAIANQALRRISKPKITAFYPADTSSTAKVVTDVWDMVLDEVLGQHPWSFSQKRVALTESADAATWVTATEYATGAFVDSDGAGTIYRCIVAHTAGVFATDLAAGYWVAHSIVDMGDGMDYAYAKPSDFIKLNFANSASAKIKIEEGGILSDYDDLKIIYTYRNQDPTTYFPLFKTALVTRLAAEIWFNTSDSGSKGESLMELYHKIDLPNAMAQDSQQGSPLEAIQDEWLGGRENAGFATTGLTWHPR